MSEITGAISGGQYRVATEKFCIRHDTSQNQQTLKTKPNNKLKRMSEDYSFKTDKQSTGY